MAAAKPDSEKALCTEAQLIESFGIEPKRSDSCERIRRTLKKICAVSDCTPGYFFKRYLPMVDWLSTYGVRENLLHDTLAGLTVGVVHLPQGLAYALLASLPPITGLYVSFFPALIYMIFGTSKHISIGTFAVVSLMIAQVIDDKVSNCSPQMQSTTQEPTTDVSTDGINVTSLKGISCEDALDSRRVEIAVALSLVNGIIQILMCLLRLGVVTTYLSTTLVSGFTCGAAFHVLTSQVPKLLGVVVSRHSGPLALIYVYVDIFKSITTINWATLIVSLICVLFIICGKIVNEKLKKRLPVPIPWELGVVIFSTLISYLCQLRPTYRVATVGNIPTGIMTSIPLMADIESVFLQALPIAIVAFATEISLSQMFATKHSYDVNANQELLALGACNIVGCFFQCFPCAPSLSRSVICDEAGAKTQLHGLFSSFVILIILLWVGPLFESLPQAALASIIVVNLKNLLKQFEKIPQLWKVCRIDAIVWVVTWMSVVLLGVSVGLAVAVAFQIFTVVLRIQCTNASILGPVGDSGMYRDERRFQTNKPSEVIIMQFPVPLIYVNRQRFDQQVISHLGFNPKLVKRRYPEIASRAEETRDSGDRVLVTSNEPEGNRQKRTPESDDDGISLSHALTGDEEDVNQAVADANVGTVKCLVLDLGYCSFLDNDGAAVLKQLYGSLKNIGVKFFLTNCNDDVYRTLRAFSDDELPPFYLDIPKAVEVATGRAEIRSNANEYGGTSV